MDTIRIKFIAAFKAIASTVVFRLKGRQRCPLNSVIISAQYTNFVNHPYPSE